MRRYFVLASLVVVGLLSIGTYFAPLVGLLFAIVGPIVLLGFYDMLQKPHAVRRNFPLIGHGRYLMEMVRPEINQYFVESNTDGKPFSREDRSVVYQRAKGVLDTVPFGTQLDVYEEGYEWMNHSLAPLHLEEEPRVLVGKEHCDKPYSCSILNISAMSFGSLGSTAVMALNLGAKQGGFAHNTGEGGISDYHLMGGDLIWQIGTGYFGCRAKDGGFDADRFQENAQRESVKMIEVKLSQGAKPGHGGILPARKLTPEIAQIRGVPMGADVISPPAHRAFSTPAELMHFVEKLRKLSGGKPVGFKLCIGKRREFLAIMKAICETRIVPDYIAIDGAEGGTGAAPLEFSNTLGCPMTEALIFAHNSLVGIGRRAEVKLFVSGKIVTGFHMARGDGPRRGRLLLGPRHDDGARLHPVAPVQRQRLPCRRGHSEARPDRRSGRRGQGTSCRSVSSGDREQHARADRCRRDLEPLGAAAVAHLAEAHSHDHPPLRRAVRVHRTGGSARRTRAGQLRSSLGSRRSPQLRTAHRRALPGHPHDGVIFVSGLFTQTDRH